MIKAVIFDCFGVLATDSWHAFLDKYFADGGPKRTRASELMDQANDGSISNRKFIEGVAELAGLDTETTVYELSGNKPNIGLFKLIDELRPEFKIGMLSNVSADLLDAIFEPSHLKQLDATVLSYDLMASKPDPITYRTIAEKLGVKPGECIFVDDISSYVDGAEQVGMKAVHYKSLEQTISDVKKLIADMNN